MLQITLVWLEFSSTKGSHRQSIGLEASLRSWSKCRCQANVSLVNIYYRSAEKPVESLHTFNYNGH
jgi:hypothetical protein